MISFRFAPRFSSFRLVSALSLSVCLWLIQYSILNVHCTTRLLVVEVSRMLMELCIRPSSSLNLDGHCPASSTSVLAARRRLFWAGHVALSVKALLAVSGLKLAAVEQRDGLGTRPRRTSSGQAMPGTWYSRSGSQAAMADWCCSAARARSHRRALHFRREALLCTPSARTLCRMSERLTRCAQPPTTLDGCGSLVPVVDPSTRDFGLSRAEGLPCRRSRFVGVTWATSLSAQFMVDRPGTSAGVRTGWTTACSAAMYVSATARLSSGRSPEAVLFRRRPHSVRRPLCELRRAAYNETKRSVSRGCRARGGT